MRHRDLRKRQQRQPESHVGLSVRGVLRRARGAAVVLLLLGCRARDAEAAPPPARANLLLVTLDTTRADRLGCYGRTTAATPILDGLARGGVLFENALSPAPITLVSHATMFTGLVPRRHGVRDNAGFRLDPSHATLASILKASGYRTAAAVSSAVLDRSTGIGRGFDVYDDRVRIGARTEFNYEERAASQVTDAAVTLLAGLTPPFFLWVHYYDPHAPYVPPSPHARGFAGSPYEGEIAFMDERIGKLLAAVEGRRLLPSTLIVVAGDHGESLGEHGEEKHDLFLYQATQRVPLLLKGPRIPAGKRVARTVGLVDLLPSILELLGLPARGTDGESLVPLVAAGGRGAPAPDYEMESFFPAYAYDWAPPLALVSGRFKYVAAPRPELYDLAADPGERVDLLGAPSGGTPEERRTARRLARELDDRYRADPLAHAFGATLSARTAEGMSAEDDDASSDEDEERRKALASLGYVGGSVAPGALPPRRARLDPKSGAPLVRELDRGRELLQAGKDAEALRVLEPLAAREPRNFPVLATTGAALLRTGAFDRAIEIARRSVALRPDYGIAHTNLAGALRAKAASLDGASPGSPGSGPSSARASALREEAAVELSAALRANPRDAESILSAAELELERSRPEAARDILRRADAADASDPDLYVLQGKTEAALGSKAAARLAFEKALARNPRSAAAHESLGRLDYLAGDARAAEGHYARSLELAPSAPVAKTLGSIRLYSLADRRGALAAFRRARELARDAAEAREIEAAIRELGAAP